MIFSRDYRKPFWHGFLHAIFITVYCLFVALIIGQLRTLYQFDIAPVIQFTFTLFLMVLSLAVVSALLFYEPVKKLLKQHFRAATVMLLSTLGWLFVFLIVFLVGLVLTLPGSAI